MTVPPDEWAGSGGALGRYIYEQSRRTLNSYREQPNLVAEHATVEQDTAQGGYQHRQLFELVQNSADALSPSAGESFAVASPPARIGGQIEIRLTDDCLYCADNGVPIDEGGVRALMFSHLSPKRSSSQIGMFGLGFKSVLGVSDAPEFFSRSGSFRFDSRWSCSRVQSVVPDAQSFPVLRLPDPIDPAECRARDAVLRELMNWATNIVRLPLRLGAHEDLHRQACRFPHAFLLFVKHVEKLALTDGSPALNRVLELVNVEDEHLLADGGATGRWKLFESTWELSDDARADRRPGDDRDDVPLWWAAPLDRLDQPGEFWAFFPTQTASLVAGILNAPWKTNEDRQNLLPGPYNDELIVAASEMIADALPQLATTEDPARHFDALPRRRETGDTDHAERLRNLLFSSLHERAIFPDQDGKLRGRDDIRYPPRELSSGGSESTAALGEWASHPARPSEWLHHRALTRIRMATVDRLFSADGEQRWLSTGAPRASIAEWLEALVTDAFSGDAVEASRAAIRTAALLERDRLSPNELGKIVLASSGSWLCPDPERVFLPYEDVIANSSIGEGSCVHPALTSDSETLAALKELGLDEPSPNSRFKLVAERVLCNSGAEVTDQERRAFWIAARAVEVSDVCAVISEYIDRVGVGIWKNLRVLTRLGDWVTLDSVLRPGEIVPGDGNRDDRATVDMRFHEHDEPLLDFLEIASEPYSGYDLWMEPSFNKYWQQCERQYRRRRDLPGSPHYGNLGFTETTGLGPLQLLTVLSDEGRVLYTDALLMLDACYVSLEMWHTGTNRKTYPKVQFSSLAVHMIREHGRIRTPDGIVPFAEALGPRPANAAALWTLLRHSKAETIKEAFALSDPIPEFLGEREPIPLSDVWPGLRRRLPDRHRSCRLIRCDRIVVGDQDRDCVLDGSDVYLLAGIADDSDRALELVVEELGLSLGHREFDTILQRRTREEIEQRRAVVRQHSTDAERLLAAVGELALRRGLPRSLLDVLEDGREQLKDTEVAEVAIATYDCDALRQFKHELGDLEPPTKWAGSASAVDFVRALGFSEEWAGQRRSRLPPFLEVDGPWSLPPLHDYQRVIEANAREMLSGTRPNEVGQRGMISMPTGSGKTRVAVQAIVESMRDGDFRGGVLWIADRDELCEQAVEAWRQVWSSVGAEAVRLRISRMWSGQERPLPTSEHHIVVATIQTVYSKFSSESGEYDFLKQFKLVVFDEAHRSIAPSSTSVMGELGLTYRHRADEPFLLGLTATPYRGHDEEETLRLVRRYGSNRLDSGAFASDDPQAVIEELQRMEVLAQVDHEVIDGGTFQLRPEELEMMSRFVRGSDESDHRFNRAWLPQSAEDRIARDSIRTRRIIEAYETDVEPDWPTLIFAASVEHSQTVAALLNRSGVKARAVSSETEPTTRRRVVEEFRNGEIKALVNYAVFGEGFDAPKTRAIIVARPVYSPNLYFQMIGRGLRGPRNGGSDRCLILNVHDNIENFNRALAFSELDWLWAR